ncbi:MAG: tetratricopeptide repeat protein [Lentisphaeraceae bacterium]|nr:tetratricopeptide repeat protein [Lentisphaeraceae bacterium]
MSEISELPKDEALEGAFLTEEFDPAGLPDYSYLTFSNYKKPLRHALELRKIQFSHKDDKYMSLRLKRSIRVYSVTKFSDLIIYYNLGLYNKVLSLAPSFYKKCASGFKAKTMLLIGLSYKETGLYAKAIKCFKTALKLEPDKNNFECVTKLVHCYVLQGNYELAETVVQNTEFKKSIKDYLKMTLTASYLSLFQDRDFWNKLYPEIKKNAKRFYNEELREFSSQYNFFQTVIGEDYFNFAKKIDERSSHIYEPGVGKLVSSQVNNVLALSKPDDLQWPQEIGTYYADRIEHDVNFVRFLMMKGSFEEARKELKNLFEFSPNHLRAQVLQGMLYLSTKDYKKAYATFGKLADKRQAEYYQLATILCLGKFSLVQSRIAKSKTPIIDERAHILNYLVNPNEDEAKKA